VAGARASGLPGLPDDDLCGKAAAEGLVIVTMDKDFLRMRRLPPRACGGVVVVKIRRRTVDDATALFSERFGQFDENAMRGRPVIVIARGAGISSGRT
jgi:predicted nuclease of predicted toxin-antitoxin system